MLELKFAIYYRASLPSQASYAVLAEESQAFFKHSLHSNSICNSAIEEEEEEEKHFGCLATFWFGTFTMLFSATGCVVGHENTQR